MKMHIIPQITLKLEGKAAASIDPNKWELDIMRLKYLGPDYFHSCSPIITAVSEAYLCLPASPVMAQTHPPSNYDTLF